MIEATNLLSGRATGPALILDEPLSFWGGMDPADGRLIDVHPPQHGAVLTGTVLFLDSGRGSSSSTSVLAESIRAGTSPAAILLAEPDPIIVLGCVVAEELYDRTCPVLVVPADHGISSGDWVTVGRDGSIRWRPRR